MFDRIFTEHVDADYGPTSHWTDRESFKLDLVSLKTEGAEGRLDYLKAIS